MKFELSNSNIDIAEKRVLTNVSLSIKEREFLRIKGKNGSGKTILMNTLLGINRSVTGEVHIEYKKEDICYISDTPFFFEDERINEIVLTFTYFYKEKYANFEDYCSLLDLPLDEIKNKKVYELSKGMRKKLCLLPLFFSKPIIFFLDEIFTEIDKSTQEKILTNLIEKHNNGATIVFVEHNESIIEKLKKKVKIEEIECKDGKLIVT